MRGCGVVDSIADFGPRDPSSNPTHPFLLFFSQNFQILWSLALYGGKLQIFYFLKWSFSQEMISSARTSRWLEKIVTAVTNNAFTVYQTFSKTPKPKVLQFLQRLSFLSKISYTYVSSSNVIRRKDSQSRESLRNHEWRELILHRLMVTLSLTIL